MAQSVTKDDIVLIERRWAQFVERRLKEFKMQLGPMKRGPKKWPRKGGGGGGDVGPVQYAVVTNRADEGVYSGTSADGSFKACLGDRGRCVLLDFDGNNCLAMPEPEEGSVLEDYKLELQCVYEDVALMPDYLIRVYRPDGGTIASGPYVGDLPVVYGEYVQPTDFLRHLQGFQSEKVLWTPDADAIEWSGGEC